MDKVNQNTSAADVEIARLIDRMVRRIHGGLHRRAPEFDTHAVGQAGGLVLLTVAELQPVRLRDVADMLARDKSQMTRMVATLEAKGLVARRDDPDDARAWLLTLTELGKAAVDQIQIAAADVISDVLAPLSDADRDQLKNLLGRV